MSRRTRDVSSDASSYGPSDLRQALSEFLPRSGLALVGSGGKPHGKLRWVPRMLIVPVSFGTMQHAECTSNGSDIL
jgi:hypothetical protein